MLKDTDVTEVLKTAKQGGVTLLDSAEGYGGGTSEARLGNLASSDDFVLVTKFLPAPWRWTEAQFNASLAASAARMGVKTIPLYFLHTPVHPLPLEYWVRLLVKAKLDGRIAAIGLSNCDAEQVQRAITAAAPTRIDCIQIHFSLVCGASQALQKVVQLCKDNDIAILGFSPIAQGLLVDGLTDDKFASSRIAKVTRVKRDNLEPLRLTISEIAKGHQVTMAQVAINWSLCKGIIPLIGVRTVKQALDAIAATKWHLTDEEVKRLDSHALALHTFEKPRVVRSFAVIVIAVLMVAYKAEKLLVGLGLLTRPPL